MKDWIVRYFRGGYLSETCFLTKKQAKLVLEEYIDGKYMLKVRGNTKGKKIYKNIIGE